MPTIDHARLVDHWDVLVRATVGLVDSVPDAEDCAATAILHCLERPTLQVDNPQAFLVTLARRRAYDLGRVAERSHRRKKRLAALAAHDVIDIAEAITHEAEARWLDETAHRLLRPHVYELLRLLADGHDMASAASRLGVPKRTAEGQLGQARRLLRSAHARTLALLGGLFALGRRTAPAAPLALAASVALVTMPLLGPAGHPPSVPVPPTTAHYADGSAPGRRLPTAAPKAPRDATAEVRPARGRSVVVAADRQARAARRPVTTVRGPAGASTVITREDRGGEAAGPAEILIDCLGNVQVTLAHVGC